jgi:hypothetical protein
MRMPLYKKSRSLHSSILKTGTIAQVRLGRNLAVQVSVECVFLAQRSKWSSNTFQVTRSWLRMRIPIAAATVLRRSRLGTKGLSGLRRRLWGAQSLGRALTPYSMIPTLTNYVDPDLSNSTRRVNIIPPIPLPHTEIPRRPSASEHAGSKAEIARVSRLIYQWQGIRRICGTVKRRRRTTRETIKRDTIGMATRRLYLRWDRQRTGVRLPLRGSLRRSVALNVAAVCRLSEMKLLAVKVGVNAY